MLFSSKTNTNSKAARSLSSFKSLSPSLRWSLPRRRERKTTKTLNCSRGQKGIKNFDDFFSRRTKKRRIPRRRIMSGEKKKEDAEGSITSSELERVITDRDYAFLKTRCGGPHALAELLESNPKSGLTRVQRSSS